MDKITPITEHLEYYKEFCLKAANDDSVFENFRRDKVYRIIVDYFSYEVGDYCFDYIFDNPYINFTQKEILEFLKNDNIGNPLRYEYYNDLAHATCSATVLKYIKTLIDLHEYFDMKSIKSITEIGCGYGGQCRIIMSKYPNIKYYIVDLPEVLELTKKYLLKLNMDISNIKFIADWEVNNIDLYTDLVISDYSFSELTKDEQDKYLNRIISKSKNGYITWDAECWLALDKYSGYELYEFIKKVDFNLHIEPEKPVSTSRLNKIITFKK